MRFFACPRRWAPIARSLFRVLVEGTAVPLLAVVHDEVYSIAREALVNAFRHSGASSIEIELEYTPNRMRVLVRDNGKGINPGRAANRTRRPLGAFGDARKSGTNRREIKNHERRFRRHRGGTFDTRPYCFPNAAFFRRLGLVFKTKIAYGASAGAKTRRWDFEMSDRPRIRVFSVDDHPLLREGIAAIIDNQPDMQMVAQAANPQEGVEQFRKHKPDVTLYGFSALPDRSGIDTMIAIRVEFPEARIIMLTTFEGDVDIKRALEAGARGYVLKSMPPKELVEVIRQVHAGKKRIPAQLAAQLAEHMSDESLTDREVEVLGQIAGGNRNRDIAERLFITEETVKVHIKHIMEKLGASDRTQAVAIGIRRGIIQL